VELFYVGPRASGDNVAVQVQCSSCGAVYSVFEPTVGRRVRCPLCHELVEAKPYDAPPRVARGTLARKVLDLAEEQGLLDGKAIVELRRQLAESKFVVTPEAIAKVLVDHGHLTPFQARKLVGQALGPEPEPPEPAAPPPPERKPTSNLQETVDLEFADDSEASASATADEIIDLEPVEPEPAPKSRRPPWKTDALIPLGPAQGPPAELDDDLVMLEPVGSESAAPPASAGLQPLEDLVAIDPLVPLSPAPVLRPRENVVSPPAKPVKNVWDSPLLLIGGGLLGVILVAFGILLYALTRGTAAELFNKAEQAYRSGVYSEAIAGYDLFLKKYSDNPDASKARVRRGMAQIRQVSDDGKNPRLALQTAKQVLPQIESEPQFSEARAELATILPEIADEFATLASRTEEMVKKEELVKLAGEAMELVNNPSYVPATLRKEREHRIAGVLDKLRLAGRGIQQDKELASALEKISALAAKDEPREAYQVRTSLLRNYPGLETNPQIVAATRHVSDKERQLVKVTEGTIAPSTKETQAVGTTTVLAPRRGPAAGAAGKPAFVLVEGSAYGIDLGSGRVLWRRYVGYATDAPPVAVEQEGTTDALLVDARNHELVRVRGATGQLVWRQALGESASGPVLAGRYVIVTTRKGKIFQVEAASGNIVRTAQLPQGATIAPAYDSRASRLFQLGEHSTLFVLSAETLACSDTIYLGHKAGSIFIPPVAAADFVLVCESPADDHSLIRILGMDSKTKAWAEIGRAVRRKGRVVTPLAVSGRRMAVITDLGQLAVYEIDSASPQQPLRLIAGVEGGETTPLAQYVAQSGNQLWVAGRRCVLFEVQASVQQFNRKWTAAEGDSFIAPLQLHDDLLVQIRRHPGSAGIAVEGCKAAGGQSLWTTRLAAPIAAIAGSPASQAVDVLTSEGSLFSLTPERIAAGDVEAATSESSDGSSILPEMSRSDDGKTLIWTQSEAGGQIYSYAVGSGAAPTTTPLPGKTGQAAAAPQMFGNGLLVPLTNGTVAFLEAGSGKELAQPFVPPQAPGTLPQWSRPVAMADGRGFLISDGRDAVYAVSLKQKSGQYFELSAEQKLDFSLVSPLISASGIAFGVLRMDQNDVLLGLDSQGKAAFERVPIQGRVQAGPFAIGGLVVLAAEPDGLLCFEAGGKLRWRHALGHGPLAGSPIASADGDLIVIHQLGVVCRVESASGKELAATDVGQPLGAAAYVLSDQLIVAGSDGVLHRIALPKVP
jgi:outer membrane protein assembly factor BamB